MTEVRDAVMRRWLTSDIHESCDRGFETCAHLGDTMLGKLTLAMRPRAPQPEGTMRCGRHTSERRENQKSVGSTGRGVVHTAQGLGTIAAMRSAIVLGPECPDLSRSRARPPCCAKTNRRVVQKQKHTHVRTMHSGAGSTGWLEREAAGNSERTSGHLGSRDVRSHEKNPLTHNL